MSCEIITGDCLEVLKTLPGGSLNCCITSPPYFGLRDYGNSGQIGLEPTPEVYVERLVEVFGEVRRVLRDDGTLWLNLGDSFNAFNGNRGRSTSFQKATDHALPSLPKGYGLTVKSLKNKDLIGIPWRVAFALQADGWYLRSDIIWSKPNAFPESVQDRPTRAHEFIFMLTKSPRYYYDIDSVREPHARLWKSNNGGTFGPSTDQGGKQRCLGGTRAHRGAYPMPNPLGRNRRSVWSVPTRAFKGAHFAVMPEALVEPCLLAGCPVGGTVLDPFGGSGTVGVVAAAHGRRALLIELNPAYCEIARDRLGLALA